MVNPFKFIYERLFRPEMEPEYQEPVEHDVVLHLIDGEMTEVTDSDPEVREQE